MHHYILDLQVLQLIEGPLNACISSLLQEQMKGMKQLLLSCIGLQVVKDVPSVLQFLQRTLCFVQQDKLHINMLQEAEQALQQLQQLGLIRSKVSTSLLCLKLASL